MPYDPIRDSSSRLSPRTPNGTVYTNPLESPSSLVVRPLSSSGGSHPPPSFGASSNGEGSLWSAAAGGVGVGGQTAGETGGVERRGGAPPPPPMTHRLSLSMLLNDSHNEDNLVETDPAAGTPSTTPRSSTFPILQPSSAPPPPPSSYRTSPSGHPLPLPPSSYAPPLPPPPPPPSTFVPSRRSSSTTIHDPPSSIQSPSAAPPGFTDAHAMPASNDTSFVMDAVNPSIKRKRDSLTVEGAASAARRKSSTSSLASKSSSGRNSSISAEGGGAGAGSSSTSEPRRPSTVRKGSDSSSTTSAVSSSSIPIPSLPLPPPPPHQLAPSSSFSSSLRSTILPPPASTSTSPHSRHPTPTPTHPTHHLPPRPPPPPQPAAISPRSTSTFPPPPPATNSSSNNLTSSTSTSSSPPSPLHHHPAMPPPPPSATATTKRTPYAPRNRTSAPRSVLIPLSRDVYTRLRAHPEEGSQNPMRGKGPSKPKQVQIQIQSGSSSSSSSSFKAEAVVAGGGEGGLVSATTAKRSAEFEEDEGGEGSGSGRRRRVDDGKGGYVVNADVAKVAEHYNARPEVGRENRHLSPIIGLKNFNNWVKSVLIGKFTLPRPPGVPPPPPGGGRRAPPRGVVLDLGCGKGGDLLKWNVARVQHYMGFDIAEVSVSQASERARALRNPTFSFEFYQLDCFAESIATIIPEQRLLQYPIDVVTMQFCMHYAFETEEKARRMLDNVSRYLRPGGTFVGTIPNAEKLIENLQAIPEDAERLAFGNEVYEISFDDREQFPIYGHRYSFFLNDAVEDVPEYLVHWGNFEALAGEYGLQCIYKKEFHDVFDEERESVEFGPLLKRMKVMNEEGESEMTEDQFAAANLYLAFAFQKQ